MSDFLFLYAVFSMFYTALSLSKKLFKLIKGIKAGDIKLPSLPKAPALAEKELKLTDEEIQRILAERESNN